MKIKIITSSILAAVALAIGITTLVLINQPAKDQPAQQATENSQVGNSQLVSFVAEKDKSVLEQLKTQATVEVVDSSFGPFVDSINGIKGGTDGKYWIFYVDGQMAQIGAAEYVTNGGELVEWKFE